MAIAHVGYVWGGSDVDGSIEATRTGATAGNALVILVRYNKSTSISVSSIACDGETVSSCGSVMSTYGLSANTARSEWYVVSSLQSSSNKRVYATLSTTPFSSASVSIWEISGQLAGQTTNGIYDSEGDKSHASASVPASGHVTNSGNCAIFAVCMGTTSSPVATGDLTNQANETANFSHSVAYDIDSGGAGSKTLQFTNSQAAWGIHSIAIKADGVSSDVSVNASGSASTPGIGTQAPGTSIGL